MKRRDAIKAVSLLTGGAVCGSVSFLAGCPAPGPVEEPFIGLLSARDVALLDEVGETILPATEESPGAKAAGIGNFMNIMVTECYSPVEQRRFQSGIAEIAAAVQTRYGSDFLELDAALRHEFLLFLEAEMKAYRDAREASGPDTPDVHYYGMIKQLTLLGYFTSEIGATRALRYVPVPGSYEPCISYAEDERAWA